MAILVGPDTRVLCQGMTGRAATYHCGRMLAYGTEIVGAVTPGKGGRRHLDRPVFDTVSEGVAETGANATMIFVPPDRAAAAMIEAIEAGVGLVVAVTERVPVLDMVRVRQALAGAPTRLVGPNSQGVLAPGITQLGVMTTVNARPGGVGIASRSASLTSEVVAQLSAVGLGQSTTVGVGGDPVHGLSLADCVRLFSDDPGTQGIVLIGELGGAEEEEAADAIRALTPRKPVVAFIAGRHAPRERRMGHSGALAAGGLGAVHSKIAALAAAGGTCVADVHRIGAAMRDLLPAA
jgi:succinyl-CoA synthetase alpha subunit